MKNRINGIIVTFVVASHLLTAAVPAFAQRNAQQNNNAQGGTSDGLPVTGLNLYDPATNQQASLSMTGQNTWVANTNQGNINFKEVTRNASRVEMFNRAANQALRINLSMGVVRYGTAKQDGTLGNNIQGTYLITKVMPNRLTNQAITNNVRTASAAMAAGNVGINNRPINNQLNNSGINQNQGGNALVALENAIFAETNKVRRQNNLPAFINSPAAAQMSRQHSQKMTRAGLSHDGMQQRINTLIQQMNLAVPGKPYGGAENVIEGMEKGSVQANAVDLVARWMQSPGHRANILSRQSTHMGVGVAKKQNGNYFATQLFVF